MYQELLKTIQAQLNILNSINIDKNKHQKLFKLIEELYNSIQNNQESKIMPLLNKIINYVSYNKELVSYKELVEINRKLLKFISASFPLSIEEELIDIASEQYLNNKISIEEYFLMLYPKEERKFDGKLTEEEILRLENAGFTEEEINEIKAFVMKHKDYLSGFHDLVGDAQVPTKQFLENIKFMSTSFEKDPNKVITRKGIFVRMITTEPLIKLFSSRLMTSKQIFENRNDLVTTKSKNYSKRIKLPKEPVIWTPNHYFKDDAVASLRAAKRPFYFMFGSLPLYFNTIDGLLAYTYGPIIINRNNQFSKKDSLKKASRAIDLGMDLYWSIEATHNKTPNLLMLEPWSGVYRTANEKGIKVVPVAHYIKDPTQSIIPHELNPIHTVVDDPIDLTQFSEKAGLKYLRDVISTWYYLMMEKYGKMSREELIEAYQQRAIYYGVNPKEFETSPLTPAEIGTLYNMDLRSTVASYDKDTEIISDYREEFIIRPEEAFRKIAEIQNPHAIQDVLYAKELIRTRKYEDYQRRF